MDGGCVEIRRGACRDTKVHALCSLMADLRITQSVDGNKGVHAMPPKAVLG